MSKLIGRLKKSRTWLGAHKLRIVMLGLLATVTFSWSARAQFLDPCCALLAAGLASIHVALTNIVGGGLKQILTVDNAIFDYQQSVVWPANLIAQARNLVALLGTDLRQIQDLSGIPVSSATLPSSQQLEQLLLSHSPNGIAQIGGAYTTLYGPIPAPASASPQVLSMVDMTDAAAQAAMKRAIEIDALADLEIQAANQLTQRIQTAAPGTAPLIEVQADAWLMRAHAYTQSATADLMRVRAIELANQGEDIKLGASNTTNLRQALVNLLAHH
ncbi:MAG: hypothetical protein JO356_05385 [Acidobacteria bacterium]|nr:hypothetical protein [Acidobacteriota bacterium]